MWKTLAVKQRVVWFIMSTRININLPARIPGRSWGGRVEARYKFCVDHDCVHSECGITYINQFKAMHVVRMDRT